MSTTVRDLDVALGSDDFSQPDLLRVAEAADALGIRHLWLTESKGRDAFVLLTQVAQRTHRIGLGTGIVNVFSRTPTALAQAAATLLESIPGRVVNLGLGTSGKALVERFHGVPFERPVSRLSEAVTVIDRAVGGDSLPTGGSVFSMSPVELNLHARRSALRIFVAGTGDATLRLAGAQADGWLPIWPSLRSGGEMLAIVNTAAVAANRPKPLVAAYIYGVVGSDATLADQVRASLAFYVAANGTAYRKLFLRYGYAAEVKRICAFWTRGDRVRARNSVTDEMLNDCALIGEPDSFLAGVGRFINVGVTWPVLRFPRQLSADQCIHMLEAISGASAPACRHDIAGRTE